MSMDPGISPDLVRTGSTINVAALELPLNVARVTPGSSTKPEREGTSAPTMPSRWGSWERCSHGWPVASLGLTITSCTDEGALPVFGAVGAMVPGWAP